MLKYWRALPDVATFAIILSAVAARKFANRVLKDTQEVSELKQKLADANSRIDMLEIERDGNRESADRISDLMNRIVSGQAGD